jgi:hypothetical protein
MFGNGRRLLGAGQGTTEEVCGFHPNSLEPLDGLFGFGEAFFWSEGVRVQTDPIHLGSRQYHGEVKDNSCKTLLFYPLKTQPFFSVKSKLRISRGLGNFIHPQLLGRVLEGRQRVKPRGYSH